MSDPTAPPAATNLEGLYNFTDAINPVILAMLKETGIFQPAAERGVGNLRTPRVECQLHMGAVLVKAKLPAGSTEIRDRLPTTYGCSLIFTVVTDRVKNGEAHGLYEARVRILASKFFAGLNSRLRFHFFESLEESGTTPNLLVEDAKDQDASQIRFSGKLSIRPTAWPVGF